jgi:hypothetical protein
MNPPKMIDPIISPNISAYGKSKSLTAWPPWLVPFVDRITEPAEIAGCFERIPRLLQPLDALIGCVEFAFELAA